MRQKYKISHVVWAACIPVGIECEHGWDVCPICDAGTVEVTKTWLRKNLRKEIAEEIIRDGGVC